MFRTRHTDLAKANQTERDLYLALKRVLTGPDGHMLPGWEVVWGFYYLGDHDVPHEGDFLLLTPTGDLVLIECKNYTNSAPNGADPVEQLNKQRAGLRTKLEAAQVAKPRFHMALGLPRAERDGPLRIFGLTPAQHLYAEDLQTRESFQTWCQNLIQPSDKPTAPRGLLHWWATEFSALPGALQFHLSNAHMESRIQQKRFFLEALASNRNLLFLGGAGTGKTWYAQEYAMRQLEAGRRVLFLVYNKLLAEHLRQVFAHGCAGAVPPLTLRTWEELVTELYAACGEALPRVNASGEAEPPLDFAAIAARLPELAVAAAGSFAGYGALVVDEAQDHDTAHGAADSAGGWWACYQRLIPEWDQLPKAICADPAQRAAFRDRDGAGFDLDTLKKALGPVTQINLPHNLRYTRQLRTYLEKKLAHPSTDRLRQALSGPPPDDHGYPVVTMEVAKAETAGAVQRQLETWRAEHGCLPSSVLILSRYGHPLSDPAASLAGCVTLAVGGTTYGLREHGLVAAGEASITVTSFHRAKGLDAVAVIIIDAWKWQDYGDTNDEQRVALWLAASRARLLLCVVTRPRRAQPAQT